jgi:hypothetical protein
LTPKRQSEPPVSNQPGVPCTRHSLLLDRDTSLVPRDTGSKRQGKPFEADGKLVYVNIPLQLNLLAPSDVAVKEIKLATLAAASRGASQRLTKSPTSFTTSKATKQDFPFHKTLAPLRPRFIALRRCISHRVALTEQSLLYQTSKRLGDTS